MRELVFDPGHGGSDPGAVANGIIEKNYQLDLALATRDRVLALYEDISIIMTRTTDTNLGPTLVADLQARCNLVMARPGRALISFHHNAAGDPLVRGAEIYIYGPNSWWPAVRADGTANYQAPNSFRLAKIMEPFYQAVMAKHTIPYRGIRTGNFHVLREIAAPGILLETFYATNKLDALIAQRASFRDDLVEAHARMIGAAFSLRERPVLWTYPTVKVELPDGLEIWGEVRDGVTWVKIPGTDVEIPVRAVAELMGLAVAWESSPPTAKVVGRGR